MSRIPSTPPSAAIPSPGSFVSESTLEKWTRSGEAVRAGALLTFTNGKRFLLQDAARILDRRDGETDPYGLIGSVELLRDFLKKGAIVTTQAIKFGTGVYDVEWGAIVYPLASADESGALPRVEG